MGKLSLFASFVELNLQISFDNSMFFDSAKSINYVPKVIIPENCRLDNKIYTGSDFFDQ